MPISIKMKRTIEESIAIPEGVQCEVRENHVECTRENVRIARRIPIPEASVEIKNHQIHVRCHKGNKKTRAAVKAILAHFENMFRGLSNPFSYELEICNVHFPMTVKLEGNKMVINNFLGEKEKRFASIIDGVHVEIKGQKIIVSSHNIEAAGQTAANIEKATSVPKRDRRVFQDGIFITSKCGVAL